MERQERKTKESKETSPKLIQGNKMKMKGQEKINQEENGITLIALIITIVILIILATITIDFAFGEEGLIKRAMQAKNLTEQATIEEQESLNGLLDKYDDIIGGGGSTPEEPDNEIKGTITFDDYEWQGDGTARVVVRTEETEYTLQYQIVGAEETIEENEWTDANSGETITGLKYGDTVYARLTDGTNESKDYANVTIEDNIAPQGTTISLSGTSTDTEGSVTATVTLKDNESGVNVAGSKWVINLESGNIGTEEASYTKNFTKNPEEIEIKNTTAGTYYLHVLTKDIAGNKSETISQAITIEEKNSEVEEAIKNGDVFEEKTEITDEQGNKVTIPEGFKVAEDSGKTVQQGIVIEDVSASTDKNVQGSQYVWIPVGQFKKDDGTMSNEIILGRYTFNTSNGTPELKQAAYTNENAENYKEEVVIPLGAIWWPGVEGGEGWTELSYYRAGTINNSDRHSDTNATAYDLGAWVDSVKENGGYYIGRYEASFASGSSYKIGTGGYKSASKVSTSFSETSMSFTKGRLWTQATELNASKVAINTYYDSNSVKSDLINSYAWDTAVVYIQEAGHTNYANKKGESINENVTNTGTGQDEVCKINDMAGNLREMTTESCEDHSTTMGFPCTSRAGIYNEGGGYPGGRVGELTTDDNDWYFEDAGFRITLYFN